MTSTNTTQSVSQLVATPSAIPINMPAQGQPDQTTWQVLKEFGSKKIAGSIMFWMLCGLAYLLIGFIGLYFFKDSNANQHTLEFLDMTTRIDARFVMALIVASLLAVPMCGLVHWIYCMLKKSAQPNEIRSAVFDTVSSQFVTLGSINFISVFFITIREHGTTGDWTFPSTYLWYGVMFWIAGVMSYFAAKSK
jgi:hypothetical protein